MNDPARPSVRARLGLDGPPHTWRLPAIETYPACIAFVQKPYGKLVLYALFALVLKTLVLLSLEMTVGAALVAMAGRRRFQVACFVTGAMLVIEPYWTNSAELDQAILAQLGLRQSIDYRLLRVVTLILAVPLAACALILVKRFRNHPLGRRPVLLQHVVCFSLIGIASSHVFYGLAQAFLWSFVLLLAAYFWYFAYALAGQRKKHPPDLVAHFATFHPFFAPHTMIPFGKGASDLKRVEATEAAELAVTQLKGLKLLMWAFVLRTVQWGFNWAVFVRGGVPTLPTAFREFLASGQVLEHSFLSVLANFPEHLLTLAVMGHAMVATARLAGFRILRNTYRPLRSRTIAEFWNRYTFYFKELLVQFYFYPTYIRCFKNYPRLRLAFATFMAAGVGNFIFHLLLEDDTIVVRGVWATAVSLQAYAFYCVVLTGGIVVSQLRTRRAEPHASWWRRQFLPSLGVMAFYCFLTLFDGTRLFVGLGLHFEFLFRVLGLGPWL